METLKEGLESELLGLVELADAHDQDDQIVWEKADRRTIRAHIRGKALTITAIFHLSLDQEAYVDRELRRINGEDKATH